VVESFCKHKKVQECLGFGRVVALMMNNRHSTLNPAIASYFRIEPN